MLVGFAKLVGSPDWPVQVLSEAGSRFKVSYFGTNKIQLILKTSFVSFTKEHLEKISTKRNLRRGAFKAAISEIRKAVENPVQDKSKVDKKEDCPRKIAETKKGLRKQRDENNVIFKRTIVKTGARRLWTCLRCGFKTAYRYKSRDHAISCNSITKKSKMRSKNLVCLLCPKLKFPSKKEINEHNLKEHGSLNMFICVKGHRKPILFKRRKDFFRHQREYHPEGKSRSRIIKCSYCKYTTKRKYNCKRHLISQHPDVHMIQTIVEDISDEIVASSKDREGEQNIKKEFIPQIISKLVDTIVNVSKAEKKNPFFGPQNESAYSDIQRANKEEQLRRFRECFKEEFEEKTKSKTELKVKKIVAHLKRKLNTKKEVDISKLRRSKRLKLDEDEIYSDHLDVDDDIDPTDDTQVIESKVDVSNFPEAENSPDSVIGQSVQHEETVQDSSKEDESSKSVERFICNICSYRTNRASNYKTHMTLLHSDLGFTKECTRPWCKQTFVTEFDRKTHTKDCRLVCDKCAKKFDRQDHFNAHQRAESRKAAKLLKQMNIEESDVSYIPPGSSDVSSIPSRSSNMSSIPPGSSRVSSVPLRASNLPHGMQDSVKDDSGAQSESGSFVEVEAAGNINDRGETGRRLRREWFKKQEDIEKFAKFHQMMMDYYEVNNNDGRFQKAPFVLYMKKESPFNEVEIEELIKKVPTWSLTSTDTELIFK